MSLLRLLTAGKSLIGLKDSSGRYEVTRQRLLPQFGSKGAEGRVRAGAPAAAASGASTVSKEAVEAAAAPPGARQAEQREPQKGRSLFAWWKPKPAPAAIPRFQRAMVQGELSLDSVKVVRNDLSDSDLEVTTGAARTAKPPGRARGAPETQDSEGSVPALPGAGARPSRSEATWRGVTERLFGVGQ